MREDPGQSPSRARPRSPERTSALPVAAVSVGVSTLSVPLQDRLRRPPEPRQLRPLPVSTQRNAPGGRLPGPEVFSERTTTFLCHLRFSCTSQSIL